MNVIRKIGRGFTWTLVPLKFGLFGFAGFFATIVAVKAASVLVYGDAFTTTIDDAWMALYGFVLAAIAGATREAARKLETSIERRVGERSERRYSRDVARDLPRRKGNPLVKKRASVR
jgi:hypothetical protein